MSGVLLNRLIDNPNVTSNAEDQPNDSKHRRGIPEVRFYEDISEVLNGNNDEAEPAMKLYNELHSKYGLMTASMIEQRVTLQRRIASLNEAKEVLTTSKEHKNLMEGNSTLFKADDCLYARGRVKDASKVLLWLGSNTLLEYDLDEGAGVLEKNIMATEKSLAELDEDICYLKEQSVMVEVALSRLHNYIVSHKESGHEKDLSVT